MCLLVIFMILYPLNWGWFSGGSLEAYWRYELLFSADYEDAIRFIAGGQIKVKKLISNHFGLKEYAAAYRYIDDNSDGSVMKVMINVKD